MGTVTDEATASLAEKEQFKCCGERMSKAPSSLRYLLIFLVAAVELLFPCVQ